MIYSYLINFLIVYDDLIAIAKFAGAGAPANIYSYAPANIYIYNTKIIHFSVDGMLEKRIQLKSLLIFIFILMPLLVSCFPSSRAPLINDVNFKEQHVSTKNPVINAGSYQYFDVNLALDAQKITIIAYQGEDIPNLQDRSLKNYYRWEYDHGEWKDLSSHDSSYIKPSRCLRENHTYSFYLSIDRKANVGHWTIKVIVNDAEVSSKHFFVETVMFSLFLSTIIGVFEPNIRGKRPFAYSDLICSERKRIVMESEENIDKRIDEVLRKHALARQSEESVDEPQDLLLFDEMPSPENELIKSTVSAYPKSRLKNVQINALHKKWGGGNSFLPSKSVGHKKFFSILLCLILLSAAFMPLITGSDDDPPEVTIINVQSYPVVGGKWTVMFTTVGTANLTITAVDGTTWSHTDENHDLKFLELKSGNETLDYEWIDNSVFIENFSSNETCYEISKVLTSGKHTLMFRFGDDIAFANNLASEYWLQTTTSDFNNGTKDNINVSNDEFHLNETYYIHNTTLINNEGFEASWPPASWSATGNWNQEGDQVYDGASSADFDGSGGGGASGNLLSPTIDCSDANVTAIYVSFWAFEDKADNGEYYLDYYNGGSWNQITRLDDFGSGSWTQYADKITDPQYFASNFQVRWRVIGLDNNEHVYVDVVKVTLETNESGYVTSGNLLSETHDTGRIAPDYTNFIVTNSTPSGTSIIHWIRAADTEANLGTATWCTDINQVPHQRWAQWRINLTGTQDDTPIVNEVNLTWNYDDDKPTSSVNAILPYWQNSTPFEITAAASDGSGSGVKEVALYYNYSADNISGWTGWALYGINDTNNPYNWSFTAPSGDGYYRFYSIAIDNENNIEDPPTPPSYDNHSGVDTVNPQSVVDDISPYWYNEFTNPLTINVSSATDSLSGVKNVTLYYRYKEDNGSAWGSWDSYGTDTSSPWQWSFNFPDSAGHYQFYSIAIDNTSNQENPPVSPDNDTDCGYDTTNPSSEVNTIMPYWRNTSPITLTGQATDFSGTGLKNVTLYYYNSTDNSNWFGPWKFGVDSNPWVDISWSFNFPNGTGYYRFYSIAVDNNTPPGIEDFTGNDTECGYDTAKPSSQVDAIAEYWHNASDNPLAINVTSLSDDLSGINNVTLYWRNSTDNITWSGPWSNGTDTTAPYSWNFAFNNGSGYYHFYSIANDSAGNQEDPPATNDTQCGYDTQKPASQVDPISPYRQDESDNPLSIIITNPSDDLSGINDITLYYRYRFDNGSSWGSWTSYGMDTSAPWSWSFNFPNDEGHYQFYSIAADNASNYEDPPVSPDNDSRCEYNTSTSVTMSLWSQSNSVSSAELTLTSSTNADGPTTGTWADANGKWAKTPYESWEFVMEDSTGNAGPVNDVTLYLKHYQTGWSNDNFKIQIWNGSNWIDVRSYTSGSGPPTADTTDFWDVKALGIDTWAEIDAAIVRIIGNGATSGEDTVDWFVDTVELRVKTQFVYAAPFINSYDLLNTTGSKLNNIAGLLDVNSEYYFSINITDSNGWEDIEYIEIKAWYDNGSETTTYNQTTGGNLNIYLQYENTTGSANWNLIWPDDEVQLILANCTETIINSTTRIINISFKPRSQVRWAGGDGEWDTTQNTTNDPYSWNFNITVTDAADLKAWKKDEYGVYKFTSVQPASDWVDVLAEPGFSDTSSIVTITYSSNYNFNMSVYFEENLTNITWSDVIPIANSVYILAGADPNDDIISDKQFQGIDEINAIDIFNDSGAFSSDNISQTVDVQFSVYIPFGTSGGKYTARVATKISHD